MVAWTSHPNTLEVEAGSSYIQGHPQLHSTFKASLEYIRPGGRGRTRKGGGEREMPLKRSSIQTPIKMQKDPGNSWWPLRQSPAGLWAGVGVGCLAMPLLPGGICPVTVLLLFAEWAAGVGRDGCWKERLSSSALPCTVLCHSSK